MAELLSKLDDIWLPRGGGCDICKYFNAQVSIRMSRSKGNRIEIVYFLLGQYMKKSNLYVLY